MTGTLLVQSSKGREVYEWDTELAESNGTLNKADVTAKFREIIDKGGFAFAEVVTETGVEREQIHRGGFDPETQPRVVITPQIAGGR